MTIIFSETQNFKLNSAKSIRIVEKTNVIAEKIDNQNTNKK